MVKTNNPKSDDDSASSGTSLYDALMVEIEPDLTTIEFDETKLAEKYAEETEEQHAERMERYKKALKLFDEAVNRLDRSYAHRARKEKEKVKEKVKKEAAIQDAKSLAEIEELLDTE